MSLMVYTKYTLPADMNVIIHNDSYFNSNTLLEDTSEVSKILLNIDDACYQSEDTFISNKHKNRGGLFRKFLSTGCKTALNVLLSSTKNNVCINPVEAGYNAWSTILTLSKGNVLYIPKSILLDGNTVCDIVYKGMHFDTISDFIQEVDKDEESGRI